MIPDVKFEFYTGVQQFYSARELRLYLKRLLESYERNLDLVHNATSEMIRGDEDSEGQSKGWFKVGNLFANRSDPITAVRDILFQVIRDTRPKVAHLQESLRTFETFTELPLPDNSVFLLYLREGVPVRIVIGGKELSLEPPKPIKK
jgi:hypothetical protein